MKNLQTFKKEVLNCYPKEACGVVIADKFIAYPNEHPDPLNNFMFAEKVSKELALGDTPYSVVHSHTKEIFLDDPRTPSHEDMKGQRNTGVQWGIVHSDGENITDILWFGKPSEKPYLGRSYISNVYDCYTLVRDIYFKEYKKDLGSHPRPADWQDWNPHYIDTHYGDMGFKEIAPKDCRKNDILGFAIGTPYINHLGICQDSKNFFHHLHERRSAIDSINKWRKQLHKVFRYA